MENFSSSIGNESQSQQVMYAQVPTAQNTGVLLGNISSYGSLDQGGLERWAILQQPHASGRVVEGARGRKRMSGF